MNSIYHWVEPTPPAPAARPAGLDLQPSRDDAARIRADPEAELADRLPRQLHSEARGLRGARNRVRQRGGGAHFARGRSAHSTTCAAIAARAFSTAAGNCPGAITCPYHGWSYKLSGELIGMPVRESFPGLDRSQFALKPVRIDQSCLASCLCRLAGDAAAVGADLGRVAAQEFAPHRFEDMVPLGPLYIEHWDCDWKIAMDNYLESYHVPIGHPGLFRMFTPDYEDQINLPTGVARGISWFRERPSSQLERAHVPAARRQGHARTCRRRTAGAGASTACCRTSASMSFPTRWISSRCCRAARASALIRGGSFALPGRRGAR